MDTLLIKPDGTQATVTPADGKRFTLEEMQKHIGGYIEVVGHVYAHWGHRAVIADEEGLLKGLPVNQAVTDMLGYKIVGNALVIDHDIFYDEEEQA
jgi:hypothetical protein